MEKEKSITITVTDEGHTITTEKLNSHEVLGLLRFYEKIVWLKMADQVKSTTAKTQDDGE